MMLYPAGTGSLVIIGGGSRPDYMMEKIIALAGGKDATIRVIPNASGVPVESAEYQVNQFKELGVKDIDYIHLNREQAATDSAVHLLENVDGIFFSGGDQSRLTRDFIGTKFLEAIRGVYNRGGVISGTSAGAAVMSEVMITGDENLNEDPDYNFISIQDGNIVTVQGFGFITEGVIDQHFIKRQRNNRLISVVLEHPDLLGIGIDESTAIVVAPDRTFEVMGENTVIIYDPQNVKNIQTDDHHNFAAQNLTMHILKSGQRYNLKTRKVLR